MSSSRVVALRKRIKRLRLAAQKAESALCLAEWELRRELRKGRE
jgi:Tfp pilus assembly protein PilX